MTMEKAWNDWNRAHDASKINPLFKREFQKIILQLGLPEKAKVLELGCGNGINRELFGEGCKLWGTDLDDFSLRQAEKRGYITSKQDAKEFYIGNKFDLIFSIGLLEHFAGLEIFEIAVRSALCSDKIIAVIPNAGGLRRFIRSLPPFRTPLWSDITPEQVSLAFTKAGYSCKTIPINMIPHIPFPMPFVWWWIIIGEKKEVK